MSGYEEPCRSRQCFHQTISEEEHVKRLCGSRRDNYSRCCIKSSSMCTRIATKLGGISTRLPRDRGLSLLTLYWSRICPMVFFGLAPDINEWTFTKHWHPINLSTREMRLYVDQRVSKSSANGSIHMHTSTSLTKDTSQARVSRPMWPSQPIQSSSSLAGPLSSMLSNLLPFPSLTRGGPGNLREKNR
jgi:hypothetical protein